MEAEVVVPLVWKPLLLEFPTLQLSVSWAGEGGNKKNFIWSYQDSIVLSGARKESPSSAGISRNNKANTVFM